MRLLVLLLLAATCALTGADLAALLRVWDPAAPLRWDGSLGLAPPCLDQMRNFALALRNGEPWAEKSEPMTEFLFLPLFLFLSICFSENI